MPRRNGGAAACRKPGIVSRASHYNTACCSIAASGAARRRRGRWQGHESVTHLDPKGNALDLAVAATVLCWLAVAAGLALAITHVRHKHPAAGGLAWAHPVAAIATLVCLWVAVALWPGHTDMWFNSGAFVVTIAFAAGGFMFSLRKSGVPLPLLAIIMHGLVAVIGCALVLVGLLRALGVAA